jgi:omega-amidase
MSNLVIAGVQASQFWEDREQNLLHFEQLLDKSDLSEVDVLVFPEMFHTGFTMNAASLAEEMSNSFGINWLTAVSKNYTCLTIASLIIKEEDQFFNRMVAVFPNGTVEHYDKRHLFSLAGEEKVFSPGTTQKIITYKDWKLNLQICFDLRFPESARNKIATDGTPEYDVLIYNANWPTRRIAHWDILIPARAVENQCYVIAVNRVGEDGNGLDYVGHSCVFDAIGNKEVTLQDGQEIVFKTTLCKTSLTEIREKLSFLKDRVVFERG